MVRHHSMGTCSQKPDQLNMAGEQLRETSHLLSQPATLNNDRKDKVQRGQNVLGRGNSLLTPSKIVDRTTEVENKQSAQSSPAVRSPESKCYPYIEGSIRVFPKELQKALKLHYEHDGTAATCSRAIDVFNSSDGRKVVFIHSETKKQLEVGHFKDKRNNKYIVVKIPPGTRDGQSEVLLGPFCSPGNRRKESYIWNGREWTESIFHIWRMSSDNAKHRNEECTGAKILKLTAKKEHEALARGAIKTKHDEDYGSPRNTSPGSHTAQDHLVAWQSPSTTPIKRRFSMLSQDTANSETAHKSLQRSSQLQRSQPGLIIEGDTTDRGSEPAAKHKQAQSSMFVPRDGTQRRSPSPANTTTTDTLQVATNMSSQTSSSSSPRSIAFNEARTPLAHVLIFKKSRHDPVAYRRELRSCKKGRIFFRHAAEAGLTNEESEALLLCRAGEDDLTLIVDDYEGWDDFVSILERATAALEVVVVPET